MIEPADGKTAGFAIGESVAGGGVHRFSHAAMATLFEIFCVHAEEKYARQAARTAFDLVDRLEQELSRFVENSDISRINHLAAGQSVGVSLWTMECLQIARLVYVETVGTFDISIGSGFESLEFSPGDFVIHAHADGVRLDLGGIGKGYAVDRIAEVLEDWEIHQALIHGGFSSVLALEPPPGCGGWPLTLSVPGAGSSAVLARISARRQALSGSGIRKGEHILDPGRKEPVRLRLAAWVSGSLDVLAGFCRPETSKDAASPGCLDLSDSPAAVADALSTAFMILSDREIRDCCRKHPGLQAWILTAFPEHPEAMPSLVRYESV